MENNAYDVDPVNAFGNNALLIDGSFQIVKPGKRKAISLTPVQVKAKRDAQERFLARTNYADDWRRCYTEKTGGIEDDGITWGLAS